MGSMNISIKKEAYDLLSALKTKGKSFSDVIIELGEQRKGYSKNILKFAGVLKEKGSGYWDERKKSIKKIREGLGLELGTRTKR
jgi:predicted CopG family antitoxin